MKQNWKKHSLVFSADGQQPWMLSHAQVPTPYSTRQGRLRLYFGTRDAKSRTLTTFLEVDPESPDEVLELLERTRHEGLPGVGREKTVINTMDSFEAPLPVDHEGSVCVFCSASIEDPAYLRDGYEFGKQLAQNRLGCISGAGNSGIMGEVVRGSVEAGGWAGGSNVPHIIELEGLPIGLSSFWLMPDIYTRMQVMIRNSDAFVIFPGGSGTVQEMLALMIFKHQGHPSMTGKPVIIFNRKDANGEPFWAPLIEMLGTWCDDGEFIVVDEFSELIPAVQNFIAPSKIAVA